MKQETGFDTANLINTDPYKITYEQFLEKEAAGEDFTPYLETQPKPEITSQTKGRCLAGQPCPQSGYWLTFADTDSRVVYSTYERTEKIYHYK